MSPVPEILRNRDFRDVWLASLVSNAGSWLQIVASGWLILEATDSP
ncbi:MAG: MFS transporter, partial [Thermoleophilia bacterium]